MVEIRCAVCPKSFKVKPYRVSTAKFCSYACHGIVKRKPPTNVCSQCGLDKGKDGFYKDNLKPRGKTACCKDCTEQKRSEAPYMKSKFAEIRRNAATRGISWNLTLDWYAIWIWGASCMYCGDPSNGGIDRMQNERFYSPDNAVPCCGICNRMKSVLSSHEFLKHIVKMTANLGLADDVKRADRFANASIALEK